MSLSHTPLPPRPGTSPAAERFSRKSRPPFAPSPQRPGTSPATKRLAGTDVIRPSERATAVQPPVIVLCGRCGVIEDRLSPPGWVIASPGHGPYRWGLCPACLANPSDEV